MTEIIHYFFVFLFGGFVTLVIVYAEVKGSPLTSRMAALIPVFTWISYLFLGKMINPTKLANHVLFVLLGTIAAWVPYMLSFYFLIPKLEALKALFCAMGVFVVLAGIFIKYSKI